MKRRAVVVAGVLMMHALVLWAVHAGLLQPAAQTALPVISVTLPMTPMAPAQKPPPVLPTPNTASITATRAAGNGLPRAVPPVAAVEQSTSSPTQSTGNPVQQATAPSSTAPAVVAIAAAPSNTGSATHASPSAAPTALAAKIELPSSDADYLHNPKPEYPPMSRRRGEQGKVVVRVLIAIDGTAQSGEVKTSSGFERLDQAALTTALRWRYVPGKRGGQAEAMWFDVPIRFVMD